MRESIESVLRQTYRSLELIVVDDGSTDGTASIIEAYARRDARVLHVHQPNRGVAAARNRAIAAARGRYIAPIDADDIWFPEKIAKQVQSLERAAPQVALAYAWSARIDATGRQFPLDRRPHVSGWVYPAFVYKNFCSASAPLIRRDCLAVIGGYDPSLRARGGEGCEDIDLLLRLADRYEFALIPEYLLGYRQWCGSMSCNTAAMERSFQMVMQRVGRRYSELPARITRWALSEFYLHLMARARELGDQRGILRYMRQAMRYDPGLFCVPHIHRSTAVALVRLLLGTSATGPLHSANRAKGGRRPPRLVAQWRSRVSQARLEFVCDYGRSCTRSASEKNDAFAPAARAARTPRLRRARNLAR